MDTGSQYSDSVTSPSESNGAQSFSTPLATGQDNKMSIFDVASTLESMLNSLVSIARILNVIALDTYSLKLNSVESTDKEMTGRIEKISSKLKAIESKIQKGD